MEARACFLFPFLAVRPLVTRARGRAFALVVVFLLYISLSPPLVVSTLAREGLFTSQAPTSVDASPSPSPTAAPSSSPSAAPASDRELILVKFKGGATSAAIDAAIASLGGDSVRDLPQIRTRVIAVPVAERASTHAAKYAKHASVERAAPAVQLAAAGAPNDPGYAQQWALPKISWDIAYASVPIVGTAMIAVLDTGIDAAHPDLAGRVLPGKGFILGGVPTVDPNGHGTAMAGIAAAKVDNLIGIAGVAYNDAPVAPVQVLRSDGTGLDSDVVAGVLWAADNGAKVILMGFSSPDFSASLQDAVNYAWSKGAVLAAATGNKGSTAPSYPAGMANVIGVAATDQNHSVAANSNTGSATVAAPGVGIYTTRPGGAYGNITGTSAAAAEVAGLAALLSANLQTNSQASIQIRGATDPVSGRSFGRINVLKALTTTVSPTPPPLPTPTPTPGPTPTYAPGVSAGADLDQCGNGPASAPVACTGTAWQNGNLNANQAHYFEGDSVPYRIRFSNLSTSATHSVTLEWDTTKSGKHAIDYLTTFNRTETTADPCSGVTGCGSPTTFAIPPDGNFTAACAGCTQILGFFTLYNGTITGVSAYTLSAPYSGNSTTGITITFMAGTASPVLAWGGHIATQADWGAGNSAVDIQGSPYHMARTDFSDGGGGRQDRSLAAAAVAVKRNVIVTKNTAGGNGTFSFTLTGPGGVTMSPTITTTGTTVSGSGTATFTGLTPATYTVTEATNTAFVPVGATTCAAVVTASSDTTCSLSHNT